MCILFTNLAEAKSCKDEKMVSFSSSTRICRRRLLLKSLGSDEDIHTVSKQCCDICTHNRLPYSHFQFLHPHKTQRKQKPKEVRYIEKDVIDSLKNALLAERKAIVKESIGLRVIGIEVACPLSCIESICAQANVISSAEDIKAISCIRSVFVERFCVFSHMLNT